MLYVLYNGYKKGIDYWGYREVEVMKMKKEKKKGRIFEYKKGRILVWMF